MSHKMADLKVFAKLHKSPPLIGNIAIGVVSSLSHFLATGNSLKIMKNGFYFIL